MARFLIPLSALVFASCTVLQGLVTAPRSCHADYFEHYESLAAMVDRAEAIVHGRVVAIGTTDEGYGAIRTIRVRVDATLKGEAAGDITIVEGPCPDLYAQEGDEWVAFLMRFASQRTSRDDGKYVSISGPQGVFPLPGGTVSAAAFEPAAPPTMVTRYAGRTADELIRDISAIAPLDIAARALFAQFGWRATRPWSLSELIIPPVADFDRPQVFGRLGMERAFREYAVASADAGYDLSRYAGGPTELLSLTLERDWNGEGRFPPVGHVLIVDRRIVGLWVVIAPQGDVYSVTQKDAALAAPPHDPPLPTPTPNRFPAGVNLARQYELASATRIFVKRADAPGETRDPVRIGEIAAALDVHLATRDAVPFGDLPWIVFMTVGDKEIRFQYRPDLDTLTSLEDGFSVTPPPRAIELIRAIGRS